MLVIKPSCACDLRKSGKGAPAREVERARIVLLGAEGTPISHATIAWWAPPR
jgi:hypothetical protein